MAKQQTPAAILADLKANPFGWPGGYDRWAVTDDGAQLCRACCDKEHNTIATSDPGDGWHVVDTFMACDVDEPSRCDHCNALLLPSGMDEDDYQQWLQTGESLKPAPSDADVSSDPRA